MCGALTAVRWDHAIPGEAEKAAKPALISERPRRVDQGQRTPPIQDGDRQVETCVSLVFVVIHRCLSLPSSTGLVGYTYDVKFCDLKLAEKQETRSDTPLERFQGNRACGASSDRPEEMRL
ncbi:hypothetical protein MTO96_002097 [Rhipicephalus appendiculatus]